MPDPKNIKILISFMHEDCLANSSCSKLCTEKDKWVIHTFIRGTSEGCSDHPWPGTLVEKWRGNRKPRHSVICKTK